MAMKLLDFAELLPIMQLLVKFHWNIFASEREGDNFLNLNIANSWMSIFVTKVATLQYFANFFCGVVLFDAGYVNSRVWIEIVLQIWCYEIYLILANVAAFPHRTKKNEDTSNTNC